MALPLSIIIVEKMGNLKLLTIKDFKIEELFKKCGFKKGEDFNKQTEWSCKIDGIKYFVEVYGKTDGRPNSENKYTFPYPIHTKLFFGSCAILAYTKKDNEHKEYVYLTLLLWNKIIQHLSETITTYIKSENNKNENNKNENNKNENDNIDNDEDSIASCDNVLENAGSELSEELYDYE
jgi:hypothetical protein